MKTIKIWLIACIMCLALTSQADVTEVAQKALSSTKEAVSNTVTTADTSSTFKEVYRDFKGAIEGMAQSLKVGAAHVYKVLVRQQVVKSISLVIGILALLIPGIWSTKFFWNKLDDDDGYFLGFIFLGVLPLIISVVVFGYNITNIVTGFVNPEYGAINEIMSHISK